MSDHRQLTFKSTDKFELQSFASRLEAFLATEHYFVEGGLVISLNGPFGSGKTTFLEMWRNAIAERRKEAVDLPVPIILNAWESDFCGDPLLSLVSAISTELGTGSDEAARENSNKLREAAKDAAWFGAGLVGGVAAQLTGFNPLAAAEFAEKKKKAREGVATHQNLLVAYEGRMNALAHLKNVLTEAFGGVRPNAIIMVDELDRCRPNYAVEYLETIKHVFDIHGIVFVLAVDKAQLRSSAKALFGVDLNFDEYYRKFAHRSVELPTPTQQGISRLVAHYAITILESVDCKRSTMLELQNRVRDIEEIISSFKLVPRQIHQVFRLIGHAMSCEPPQRGKLLWGFGAAAILMSALSVANPILYSRIGQGSADIHDFEFLFKLLATQHLDWWAMVIFTGYGSDDAEKDENLLLEFIRIGALPSQERTRA